MIETLEDFKQACDQMAALEQRLREIDHARDPGSYSDIIYEIGSLNCDITDYEVQCGYRR